MKKIFLVLVTVITILQVIAHSGSTILASSASDPVVVDLEDLQLSQKELNETIESEKELVKDSSTEEYDKVIDQFMNESDNSIAILTEEFLEKEIEDVEYIYDQSLINEYRLDEDYSIYFYTYRYNCR